MKGKRKSWILDNIETTRKYEISCFHNYEVPHCGFLGCGTA
jgi:hypothetical protein